VQKRICPHCFTIWFSSDTSRVWECESCGHDIPVPKENNLGNKCMSLNEKSSTE